MSRALRELAIFRSHAGFERGESLLSKAQFPADLGWLLPAEIKAEQRFVFAFIKPGKNLSGFGRLGRLGADPSTANSRLNLIHRGAKVGGERCRIGRRSAAHQIGCPAQDHSADTFCVLYASSNEQKA